MIELDERRTELKSERRVLPPTTMYASGETAESEVLFTLVTQTAARRGVDPVELEPLATVIDPELVSSFATSDAVLPESELRFEFNGCEVRVRGNGDVTVQAPG